MNEHRPFCAGFYDTVVDAERAIAALLAFGFSRDQMAVICPKPFHDEITRSIARAETPASHAAERMVEGSFVGAALGGVALAAVTIASAGLGLLPGAMVLIGGGAIAGGFAGLVLDDGYEKGIGEYYAQAVTNHQIVVGVYAEGDAPDMQITQAARILKSTGAKSIAPQEDPTKHPPVADVSTNSGVMAGI